MKLSSEADTLTLAGDCSSQMPVFQRSPLIKTLKSVLGAAQSFLPKAMYEPMYEFSFRIYKGMLRVSYSRHLFYESAFGSSAGQMRAKLVHSVMPYSLVGSSGLEATYDAAAAVIAGAIPGDFVECGVAQGGCSALMAMVANTDSSRRKMWLFDSFQGIPDPTAEDFDEAKAVTGEHIRPLVRGSCLGTKSTVESVLFSTFGLSRDSVCLVEGWFQDTLPVYRDRIGPIALLRLDGDWYESTLCCLHNLYDHVSPGGYIIIDDYGSCFGCKKAVHEFLDSKDVKVRLIPDGRGGVLFSKPV
jgi:O-methyltransferase